MVELGIKKADLARAVGTSTAMITMLFDEKRAIPVRSSKLWPAIEDTLGGRSAKASVSATDDAAGDLAREIAEDALTILENWSQLSPGDRRAVAALVTSLTRRRS